MIRNDNPDKGTEIPSTRTDAYCKLSIRNDNPDKGTETTIPLYIYEDTLRLEVITPIRGRKRLKVNIRGFRYTRLEMITPIRGRKQAYIIPKVRSIPVNYKYYPDRGRKYPK